MAGIHPGADVAESARPGDGTSAWHLAGAILTDDRYPRSGSRGAAHSTTAPTGTRSG